MEPRIHRTMPLARGLLKGKYIVTEALIDATRRALVKFCDPHVHSIRHEGLVFWGGMEVGGVTLLTTAVVPETDHCPHGVFVNEAAVGAAARLLRQHDLGLLCQVHSHPGCDARHSDGDDELIVLPFEGMLSIVAPYFGRELKSIFDAQVHQYQGGKWVLCNRQSVQRRVYQVPTAVNI